MIYPPQFEYKIGFDKIRTILEALCISPMGKTQLKKLAFSAHFARVQQWLSQTEEMKALLLSGIPFPAADFYDLRKELQLATVEGNYLLADNLNKLMQVLGTMQSIQFTITQYADEYPMLHKLLTDWEVFPDIKIAIETIIDESGHIKDTASENLLKIRQQLHQHYAHNENHIQEHLRKAIQEGWTATDSQIAIRNGRLVVPLFAQHKRQIKGFVHAESASGQTVFVEPQALFQLNNEIVELEAEVEREIQRILLAFTQHIRPHLPNMIQSFETLGVIDFLMAKARFSIDIEGVKPDVRNESIVDWQAAKHPLLLLSLKQQDKEIVPLNIALKKPKRVLVISGPNAGGKSVALKSVGLLQYMLQCGLLVPMKPTSVAGVFKHFFIDIGDEQSIENDLSTYSSHLLNMKYFLHSADERSLFLIDEMGGGTDPHMGGAIAEAVLEKLAAKGAYGLVTTHFSNLKLMASPDNSIENAAMLFNANDLEPLYQLQSGYPGSSFTIEIASKIGFPSDIIDALKGKINQKQLDFEVQLQQLDVERKALQQQQKQIDVSDQLLSETLEKYQRLYQKLQADKQSIIRHAKEEAKDLLNSSNKLIENAIHDIKKSKADKVVSKQARVRIQTAFEDLKRSKTESAKQENIHHIVSKPLKQSAPSKQKAKPPKIGDRVKIEGQNGTAILENVKGKEATVVLANMRMRIAYHKLQKVAGKTTKNKVDNNNTYSKLADDINERTLSFQPKIDLRGVRLKEAMEMVHSFVDEAIVLGVHELQILHGKGTGVLREHIRQYLNTVPEVSVFMDEHVDRGGHGITIVRL